ncbi:hypothetical protein RJ640_003343 [Escallonia rubra]|uniref:Pentatricopeptide repeat-containing protein n=1 Tax=Escallonia rubra TaxID=112253 RepID=A0AA88R8K1_9ASTE|nr:hypothetical protein RJ640_003343 [Escallonia rubra]
MLVEEAIPVSPTSPRARQQHLFSLLQNFNTIKKATQIHTQIITNGFSQKNSILLKLLSLYISSDHLHHVHQVFKGVRNPSTAVWNQIIRSYAKGGTPRKSLELYNQMQASNALPDSYTYSFAINGCAKAGQLREGEQVHARVLANGFFSNVFVQTNLVNLYAVGGGEAGLANARKVFDEMTERSVVSWNSMLAGFVRCVDFDGARRVFDQMPERNVVSWTTMVSGYAQNGRCKQALALFREMQRARVELDQVTLVAALSACAEIGDLKMGRWIHAYIDGNFRFGNQPLKVSLNNALIHMYASCGVIEEAYDVFIQMPQTSTVSWTTMITGFAKQGQGKEALTVFRWMQSLDGSGAKPDEITLVGVLCACSHAGFVDKGRRYFKCMNKKWGIEPRIEHYECIVDLLSRAGFLDEAHRLVETMPMKPNDAVWGALLSGCRIHKNVELASQIAQKLAMELDPDQAAGYFVLLSNVFDTAQRWKDIVTMRQKMLGMGVKKTLGRSWVQVAGIVHDFLAGDRTHKHTLPIYEMLAGITQQGKQEGYKPDISQALLGVEE